MDLDHIRALCLSFPGATEDVKWGDNLTFCVGEKMFAITGLEVDGPRAMTLSAGDAFETLVARDGFRPAPYLARYGWVQIADVAALPIHELEELIGKSHQLVLSTLSKKLQLVLDGKRKLP